jgi:hypothetical protein
MGMKFKEICAALLFLLMALSCITISHAENILSSDSKQEIEKATLSPIVYSMKFVYVFEENKSEIIIVVGNAGFKSIASLKNWAKNLPSGTTIEFDMTCRRLGSEPFVNSEKEMDDFKDFCKQHNINLAIRPAG